ncbi:MAG: tryptophan 7-halogenase [Verrucomicrobiales bacterium]|nr:tryptophan 7-halogenase [Verrucomicrobiales bacterium]
MFDVVVIGSGFGGSFLSMVLRRLGRTVLLIEKHRHPRFVIGESSTPLADLLWLNLTERYGLPSLAPFAKWGTWRRNYPEVSCGLKRGFTFFHHQLSMPFGAAADRSDQLMVAASPRDEIADTHWYRPEFDQFLVREAIREGVEYVDHCEVMAVEMAGTGATIRARHEGRDRSFAGRVVIDASNHRGPVAQSLGLKDEALPYLPPTQGLYAHFTDVARLDALPIHRDVHSTPYPIDDAAVHHVFDGGWFWVLRFCNGITSAGVAATDHAARRWDLSAGAKGWDRLVASFPTVAKQFSRAVPTVPFVHAPRLAFATRPAAGDAWALLPSAAGFIDPLLSSGFTLTLLGIERLARAFELGWEDPRQWSDAMKAYAEATWADQRTLERYIAALYARMGDFPAFTEIARLYFCAVIYSETSRRLSETQRDHGFLMRDHPEFSAGAASICDRAMRGEPAENLRRLVEGWLGRFDLGGLDDPVRRPWYPVVADDLRLRRERIGATADEIERLIARAGFQGRGANDG